MKIRDGKFYKVALLILTMIFAIMLCGFNFSVNKEKETEEEPVSKDVLLTESEYPFYFISMDDESTIKLYFTDESREIPYIDSDTAKELLERTNHEANNDKGYKLSVSENGSITTFTRENKHTMTIDSEKDVISFVDYDAFFAPSWSNTVIDTLEHYGTIDYLQINKEKSYSRSGSSVDIDMSKYGIDIIGKDGKCYIPLQTFSDIAISLPCYVSLIYNRKAVYANELTMKEDSTFFSNLYSAGTGKRSRNLADFTYNEFCMVMDHFYGLKDRQGIEDSFDKYIADSGLKDRFLSEDPEVFGMALSNLLELYIDDLHSFYLNNSYLAGKDLEFNRRGGLSLRGYLECSKRLEKAREEKFPNGVPAYEEIGNTAFITFDQFDTLEDDTDYYKNPPTADTKNAVGILLYAFNQITRKDSPIENVVFDLSLNGGGDQTTTCFMLSMILGDSSITVEDTLTGAFVCERFMADANLDGKFDAKDSLAEYNLYCITSPCTFSCANLAASELNNSHMVTILGQTSGGGTCIVIPFTLADGTFVRVSSCRRFSNMKNGALYDIDQGIEPDIYIGKPSAFYDRDALTEYINSIP